tara:strand:+ start:3925 stop:7170 length:3246 start_codon:yes stop_codon:yes gene_type:complete
MSVIVLPNGQRINTEGLSTDQITSALTELQKQQPTLFEDIEPKVDLATASREEILEYKRKRDELAGTVSGSELDTTDSLKDPNVDYTTGLKDFRIRAGFSNKELDSEKAAYLTDRVGSDGFRQDKGGRFIITKEGRKKLGMPDGPEFAVDEEGASRYDIADFLGESGIPLTVGIGASIAASGVGLLPGLAIVGGATAVGKLLDEAFESAQGYQRQTAGQIAKDAAWEGVFGATGEGVGRGLSALFGRLFKGSGSKTAEDAKEIGREMRQLGFQPTVEGAAPGAFGILTRLQAIYEGISPNKKAAEQNVKALLEQLKNMRGFNVSEDAIETLGKEIQDDITKLYSSYDDAFNAANRELDTEIEKRIAQIMEPLKRGEDVGRDAVEGITEAKNIFNKNVDFLYKKTDQALGRNNQIIPLGKVQEEINKGLDEATRGVRSEFGRGSAVSNILNKVKARAIKRLQAQGIKPTNQAIMQEMRATTVEATQLRNIMSELEFTGNKTFGRIKSALDDSFNDAEDLLNVRISVVERNLDELGGLPGQMTSSFQGNFGGGSVSIKNLKEGLTLLRRTKQYYARGYKRLNDPVYQSLVKATGQGRVELDPTVILNRVVKKDQPKLLERILRSRRGIGLKFQRLDETPTTIRFGDRDISLREAEEILRKGDLADPKRLQQKVNEAKAAKAREADEVAGGGVQGEELRQSLASAFLKDALSRSTIDGVVDGKKFAKIIDDLGSTKDVLFNSRLPRITGELEDLNELTSILRSNATELDDSVIQRISSRPLAEALQEAKNASLRLDAVNKQTYLKSLQNKDASKIVDTIFTKNNPQMIKAFMNNTIKLKVPNQADEVPITPFSADDHADLVENVKNAAMARILRSIGDVDSPMFADDFLSGRLGGKFKTSLEGYGRDSLNAMFGKSETDRLFKLSEIMIRASDKPLAGKGGLAAPSIALGLSIFGLMTAPFKTLGALAFYTGMSRALRSGSVLDIMLASRKPGADQLGQALQTMQTINAQLQTQTVTSDEGPFKLTPEANRMFSSAVPDVTPVFGGTSAAKVDPTNPIINPNPMDQALAQRLAGTSAISPRLPN